MDSIFPILQQIYLPGRYDFEAESVFPDFRELDGVILIESIYKLIKLQIM